MARVKLEIFLGSASCGMYSTASFCCRLLVLESLPKFCSSSYSLLGRDVSRDAGLSLKVAISAWVI